MLNVGDTIKCHDKNDLVETMVELSKQDIFTDFLYSEGLMPVIFLNTREK